MSESGESRLSESVDWRYATLSCDAAGNCRAFLWQNSVMTDLNSLIEPGYADVLTTAQDINDLGQVTGRAFDPVTGERPAFVATPIPGQGRN